VLLAEDHDMVNLDIPDDVLLRSLGGFDLPGLTATHVQSQLESFTLRESLRGLGLEDRVIYLTILGTLSVFVNISIRPSPHLGRIPRLQSQRHALMNIHTYLRAFDSQLASVYARDSHTSLPSEPAS